jgi:hypothetical protein
MLRTVFQKQVKARKRHFCGYCGEPIEVGETYESTFVIGDHPWIWRTCLVCLEFIDAFDPYHEDEGLSSDEFDEAVFNECHRAKLFLDEDEHADTETYTIHEMVVGLLKTVEAPKERV